MVLDKLDDIVLRGYEKVSYWAYKKFGKDKYDLAQACDTTTALALAGERVYSFLLGYQTGGAGYMFLGGLLATVGYISQSASKKTNERRRGRELQQIINTGAAQAPANPFRSLRPLGLGGSVFFISKGISHLVYGLEPPESLATMIGEKEYGNLNGLWDLAISIYFAGWTSASYFRDTTMFPPQKDRKPLWKRAIDYVTSPFRQKAPVPVEE